MTPIGHASLSYITGKAFRRISISAIIFGGLVPDFDFLFLFFDWFNQVHRVVSHNLFFIVAVSFISSVVASKGRKTVVGLSVLSGGLLHLFFDSFMDINPTNGIGIAAMWPFSNELMSPFNILEPSLQSPGWNNPLKMIVSLMPVMLYELPFYILSVFLIYKNNVHATIGSRS
jgi:membrane-bound metal-dependent hydrolase YbcI (DUF457 family)